jgi:tyrosinase
MTSTTHPLELPELEDTDELSRADLVFYGVDHSGPSYEARIFVNNPNADADTERAAEQGYAGAFTVFGHNGCFGADGHCLPDQRSTDAFDVRAPHPLRGLTKTVIATDAIRRAIVEPETQAVTVTLVAVTPDDGFPKAGPEPGRFDYVRLLTYET